MPRTGDSWCGSRCCSSATRAWPRSWCRTPSWRCTPAGPGCATPTGRSPTCARRSSTGPARRCGTAAWSSGTPPRRPPRSTPGADHAALATDRRAAVLDAMRTLPRAAARGAGAALLPGPVRGRDRRHPRHQPGRGEEPRLPWRRRPAQPARRRTCERRSARTAARRRRRGSSPPTGSPRSAPAPRTRPGPRPGRGSTPPARPCSRRPPRWPAFAVLDDDSGPRRRPVARAATSRRRPLVPAYFVGETPQDDAAVPRVRRGPRARRR